MATDNGGRRPLARVTGFEFLTDGTGPTVCRLKTTAGDVHGIFHNAGPILAGAVMVSASPEHPEGPAGVYAWLADRLAGQGIVSFRLMLRQPDQVFEVLRDTLSAVTFLDDFGVDKLVILGDGVGAVAGLRAGVSVESVRGVAALEPATAREPEVAPGVMTLRLWHRAGPADTDQPVEIDPADAAHRDRLLDWALRLLTG